MKININKKNYELELKYNFKAFRLLSEERNIEVEQILAGLEAGNIPLKHLVPLLWAGMYVAGQKIEYEVLLNDFDNSDSNNMPPLNDIKMLILDKLTEAFTKDSKNESSLKATIPNSKKRKKNGAGGATSEKLQK